ncbi:MAG: hypothetical protein IPI67_07560 [Myxococcales bacterium]|nr:hypothetical protein [Myxococcales bacterium]
MRSRSRTRFGLFASLTLGFVACGGRSTIDFGLDPGPAGGGGSGGFGGTGVVGGSGGISGDGGAPGGGAGGVAGEAGAPGGGASGAGGGGFCEDPGSPCEICTCDNCPDELKACADNGGCMPILACAQNAGCSGAQCLGPCGPVINQNGGPLGKSANLAQQVGQCRAQAKCDCGAGGSGGTGGGGGTGTGGGGGTGPLACIGCVAQKCPSVQQCVLDQKCRDGAICAMQKCLSGGGGGPNLQCMIQCFNGDFGAAFQAFQGIQCFLTSCGQTCGGVIPGLPGGGTPPGG